MELQLRGAAVPDDFDVAPQHLLGVTGAERLHGRFLRGKPAGEVNGRLAPRRAVRDFAVGENTARKPVAIAIERPRDTIDFRDVDAETDDVGHGPEMILPSPQPPFEWL